MDECPLDQVPKLSYTNKHFYRVVLSKVLPGLHDGMGGLSYSNIQVVLDELHFQKSDNRQWIFGKILAVAEVINKVRKSEKK